MLDFFSFPGIPITDDAPFGLMAISVESGTPKYLVILDFGLPLKILINSSSVKTLFGSALKLKVAPKKAIKTNSTLSF